MPPFPSDYFCFDARYGEAKRFNPHEEIFLNTAKDVLDALAPVIDRWPRYAWVAKHLLEPERVSELCTRDRLQLQHVQKLYSIYDGV